MAVRVGKSFADLVSILNQLQAGLKEGAAGDPKQEKYLKEVSAALGSLTGLDDEQEKAKKQLNTITEKLEAADQASRELAGKIVSYLESEFGKSSPELQRYGIARRIPGKRKPGEAKAAKA